MIFILLLNILSCYFTTGFIIDSTTSSILDTFCVLVKQGVNSNPDLDKFCDGGEWNCTVAKNISIVFQFEMECDGNDVILLNMDDYNSNSAILYLPDDIGNTLTSLTYLSMNENSIGSLPESVSNLTNLQYLSLNTNEISSIPEFISNLTNLQYLDISVNYIYTLPSLEKLTRLNQLILNDNLIYGTFGVLNTANLTFLELSNNYFYGSLPSVGLLSVNHIHLDNNNFEGAIPKQYGLFSKLIYLYIRKNSLIGSLPSELIQLNQLRVLDLSDNNLSGSISDLPKSLRTLSLGNNNISGDISNIGKIPLASLILTNNSISKWPDKWWCENGSLPDCFNFNNWQYINLIDLSINKFNITNLFIPYINVPVLDLSSNRIWGQIERISGTVLLLYLTNNTITHGLNNIFSPNIIELDISNNNLFDGPTLSFDEQFPDMRSLILSKNHLEDQIPDKLNLPYLRELYLDSNHITGTLPESLPSNLIKLYLDNNHLSGTIPPSLPSTLVTLSLPYNRFTGSIPTQLGLLPLSYIDLNNLTLCGCFPEQWLHRKFTTCSLEGNAYNCGSCNYTFTSKQCRILPCSFTVDCLDPNPCINNTHHCKNRDCIPLKIAGYTCGPCPSGYYSDAGSSISQEDFICINIGLHYLMPIGVAIGGLLLIGIIWKLCMPKKLPLPKAWFWDEKRLALNNYFVSATNPEYYHATLRRGEESFFKHVTTHLGISEHQIIDKISLVCPGLASKASYYLGQYPKKYEYKVYQDTATISEFYLKLLLRFEWNNKKKFLDNPVLPALYVCEEREVDNIASLGFLTSGIPTKKDYFGEGHYFTTSIHKILPTLKDFESPVVLICFTFPGNPFFITRPPAMGDNFSFFGNRIISGYDSHYAVLNERGSPIQSISDVQKNYTINLSTVESVDKRFNDPNYSTSGIDMMGYSLYSETETEREYDEKDRLIQSTRKKQMVPVTESFPIYYDVLVLPENAEILPIFLIRIKE